MRNKRLEAYNVPKNYLDLPVLARYAFRNNATAIDLESDLYGHVDIPRLRKGQVGGFFW